MNFLHQLPLVSSGKEVFETIAETDSFIIERIVSNNAIAPAEGWFYQQHDEWVMVLQGRAIIETETDVIDLHAGDTLLLKAHTKHKVVFTSSVPVCVWLAVHEKKSGK